MRQHSGRVSLVRLEAGQKHWMLSLQIADSDAGNLHGRFRDPGISSKVGAVCVDAPVRFCAGAIRDDRPYRVHADVTGLYLWLLFMVRPTKTFVARDRGCVGITARRR